jgi:NAD(P)H dehydrogenase (quinone)
MKVLIVFYSAYGHVYRLAEAVAEGARQVEGALVGKVGSVFTSSNTQHGGQEITIVTTHMTLLHHGMVVAGLPYAFAG